MRYTPTLTFKVASEGWEVEAIHRLNYQTFVEEIPQHEANTQEFLVDRFHNENTYLISLDGRRLAGMIALRGRRPFSLDLKLPELDKYLPPGRCICEVRLLAVDKNYRHGAVLPGLVALLEKYGRAEGYDTAIISGTLRQMKLYRHMGFVPFGPPVGHKEAMFQPMILTYENYKAQMSPALSPWRATFGRPKPVNFLPGPVAIHPSVRRAFTRPPESHRSRAFRSEFQRVRAKLCRLVSASQVEILLGSGTLATDAIAGQLSLLGRPGVILTNGEFSERLVDQARRFQLCCDVVDKEWGQTFTAEDVCGCLEERPEAGWLWTVHCETSTGVLNDLEMLAECCGQRNVKLCLDCVSTIGSVPVDLRGVYLASGVSGKGIGSLPGLAMVFYHHPLEPAPGRLPRYLDLGYYAAHNGIPFTQSSNLLRALEAALDHLQKSDPFSRKLKLSAWLRRTLQQRGFRLLASQAAASPGVVTLVLPESLSSEKIGWRLEEEGFQLSYRSEYLRRRNWLQICLMGECRRRDLLHLVDCLTQQCRSESASHCKSPDPFSPRARAI